MINKTFVSFIVALLLMAMCLQFFVVSTSSQLQSGSVVFSTESNTTNNNSISNDNLLFKKQSAMLSVETDAGQSKSLSINIEKFKLRKQLFSRNHAKDDNVLPSIIISGTVTDYHDNPLAGAVVKPDGKPRGVRTDSSGRYKVSVERLDNNYPTLIFLKSGYKKKMLRIVEPDLDLRNSIAVNMQMDYSSETVSVYGWLGETNGASVKDEVIKLTSLPQALYYSTRSDVDGNFIFEGVQRDIDYKIGIKHSEKYHNIVLQNLTINERTRPLYITLEPVDLINLEGVVVDSYGGPVKKLKFKIRSELNSTYDTNLTTDEFGRFEVQKFPMGPLSFTTQAPLYFKVTGIDLSQLITTDVVIPVDVGPHRITGWVRDQFGLPLSGARAMLDAEFDHNGISSTSIRTFVTDEAGYFEFTKLGPGEHYVTVYAKGFINQGMRYDTSVQFEPLHLQLSQWGESLTSSTSLKVKQLKSVNQIEPIVD